MKKFLIYAFTLLAPLFAMAQQSERPQYVVFQVTPKTATVAIGDKSVSTDSEGIAIFMLENGSYSYTVSADDCHNVSGYIYVEGQKVVKSVELSPAYGWLKIPDIEGLTGAKVYVDGSFIGMIPVESGKLSSGSHTIRIVHDKYKVFDNWVTIKDGKTLEYTPKLTPRTGTLNVTSTPAMANVYVDGELVGQTPLMVDVTIGDHKIDIRKGFFGADSHRAIVSEGEVTDVNLTLIERVGTTYVETVKGLNMKMVLVEGGTFQMGATSEQGSDADDDEKPAHSVTLDSYYIAETEVTQAQWRAIMGTNPSNWSGDNRPVENIYWEDACEFCKKLSQLTGKQYALPTEAQWEYAARGGNKSNGYKYSGSYSINDVAWYDGNSSSQTHSVKQKQPNELGLYDMTGNVWEWCSDWYGDYSSSSQTNPTGPSGGSSRVIRGGGWYDNAGRCRVSYRDDYYPSNRTDILGFRLVCIP